MRRFFLLFFLVSSFFAVAQVDTIRRSDGDSLLEKELNKMLDTTKVGVVPATQLPPDSLKNNLGADSVRTQKPDSALTRPDTAKPPVTAPDTAVKISTAPKDSIRASKPVLRDSLFYLSIRQSPDSIKYARLDSLTNEELLEYYQSEPFPPNTISNFTKNDTLYNFLNPFTLGTNTVTGESLRRYEEESELIDNADTTVIDQQLRPKIGMGAGRLSFHGDLMNGKMQSILIGKPAVDLAISQRLTRYLQLDFSVLFGKLASNQNTPGNPQNFQSEIRAAGVNLLYDFGNLIPDRYTVRPYLSFGVYGFEFLSKTDMLDENGKTYHYWNDGSIRDMAEGSANAQFANHLVRDYTYESDVRELNRDGFGKYREAAWAFPIGAGVVMKINDRVDLKLNYQYYISTTDYIDGISENSLGARKGNKRNDNFSYLSVGLQYDLTVQKRKRVSRLSDTINFNDEYLMALFNQDNDKDSIIDVNDECLGTPEGVAVDAKGCPVDGDNDGVPDFRDDELASPQGLGVNLKGVAYTDAYWQTWYDRYLSDTLSGDRVTEYTGNIYAIGKKKEKKDPYTVELMRYNGSIPSDELAFLLSIGDINSTTLEDGSTVVYTSGNYQKLGAAIKRRDEFRDEGNKKAGVSMFKGRDVVQLPEDELESLLKTEIEDLLNMNINQTDSGAAIATNPDEAFSKNEIVYRVQLGAFRNKISTNVFGANTGVIELRTGENVYRYVTKGYPTIEEAAAVRADLVVQGYSDAFVTAYRGGRRIPMSQTKATVDKNYKEDLSEDKTFSSIDKSLLSFKVQLGPLKKKAQEAAMDERVKEIPEAQKQVTSSGSLRYTAGNFPGMELAEEFRKTLESKGFTDAFIIATFKGEIISMQEAMELMK